MCKIRIDAGDLDVVLLPRDEFYRVWNSFFEPPDFDGAITFDDYITEKRETEDWLRKALSARWKPIDDFEVASDQNISYTMCGGIYSPLLICRDYLNILFTILRTARMRELWIYSTSVELDEYPGRTCDVFGLHKGTLYVESSKPGFDFVKCFSRSKAEADASDPSIDDWRWPGR